MPYFFILPLFVLYVAALGAAILCCRLFVPSSPLRSFLVGLLVWSSIGFVVATLAYVAVFVGVTVAYKHLSGNGASTVAGVGLALLVFVAPFASAAAGVGLGGAYGVWRVWKRGSGPENPA